MKVLLMKKIIITLKLEKNTSNKEEKVRYNIQYTKVSRDLRERLKN